VLEIFEGNSTLDYWITDNNELDPVSWYSVGNSDTLDFKAAGFFNKSVYIPFILSLFHYYPIINATPCHEYPVYYMPQYN
jgi:hypothetical protein